ncbi:MULTISPECIES: hypothetical protein [Saccharibacillus]|uniref:hypothetical protein n=1 Tax=Saccharibacillus TaxID=456492 RepID=UPI00123A8C7D|nr:hypothetical protein [Saccharibacillus sp. WB 17]MWJ33104.1 hypothetical protein [Saccharibacillus sp. WB 17]
MRAGSSESVDFVEIVPTNDVENLFQIIIKNGYPKKGYFEETGKNKKAKCLEQALRFICVEELKKLDRSINFHIDKIYKEEYS